MIYIVYTLILKGKNTRKVFFHSQDPAMSPRGGLTMGRIADGRCELVDLSVGTEMPTHTPGSAFSNRVFPPTGSKYKCWQMTLPPLQMLPSRPSPRGAVSMTEESVVPLCLERIGTGTAGTGAQQFPWETVTLQAPYNRGSPHETR